MENVLSSEERYKRAYELYLQRDSKKPENIVEKTITKKSKVNKLLLQTILSSFILFSIFTLKNINVSYASDILHKINGTLNYNTDFSNMYNKIYEYMKSNVYSKINLNEARNIANFEAENTTIEITNVGVSTDIEETPIEQNQNENANTEVVQENAGRSRGRY